MLRSLPARVRRQLLRFIAAWMTPAPVPPLNLSDEIVSVLREIAEARSRNDCRALGAGRERLRKLRFEGLLREVAARREQAPCNE